MMTLTAATSLGSDTLAVVGVVVGVVAIALAVFTIWQAWNFYRESQIAANRAEKAATDIANGVQRLEAIFDRFYKDTFGMMRDTVTDMRQHVWAKVGTAEVVETVDAGADKRFSDLRNELRADLQEGLTQMAQKVTSDHTIVDEIEARFGGLLDRAVSASRQVEGEVQQQRATVMSGDLVNGVLALLNTRDCMSVPELAAELNVPEPTVAATVRQLTDAGLAERMAAARHGTSHISVRITEAGSRDLIQRTSHRG